MRMDHCNAVWLRMLQLSTDYSHSHHGTQLLVHSPSTSLQTWPPYDRRCFSGQYAANPLLLVVHMEQRTSSSINSIQTCAKTADQGVMTLHWLLMNSSGWVYTSAMLCSLEVRSVCNISAEGRCKYWLDNIYMETDIFHGCREKGSSVCGTKVC